MKALAVACLCVVACGESDATATRDAGTEAGSDVDPTLDDAGEGDGDRDAATHDGATELDAGACGDPPDGPVPCLGDGCEVLLVASGDRHSCVVVREGFAYCWGANERGQLGDGTTCDRARPVRVRGAEGAIEIAAGRDRTCARLRDGTAACWGSTRLAPEALDVAGVSAIGVGADHVCVIAEDRVRCYGASDRGQLGVVSGSASESLLDVAVPGTPRRIAVGGQHTCVRMREDEPSVACWGDDRFGQRGGGSVHADPIAEIATPTLGAAPQSIASGRAHSCALSAGGVLHCWGDATTGAIGLPATGLAPEPRAVALGDATALALAAHGDLTCLLLSGGAVACLGDDTSGQLGGADAEPGEAVVVPGVVGAVQLAPGSTHVCALVGTGEVVCWGANDRGQLGRGTSSTTELPGAVTGLPEG